MAKLLEFLNTNSGALSALFSGVVTIATIVYAWLTAKLVHETRQMRQVQTEPRIQVTYRVSEEWINFLDISIRNIGLAPAYEIQFSVRGETSLPGTQELLDRLMKLSSFKNGLAYLGPREQYISFWTSLVEGDQSKVESRLVVDCSYRSAAGATYRHPCIVDLSELKGSSRLGEPPLLKMAKHIEAMAKDIHQMTTGFGKAKVDVYTQSDRDDERAKPKTRFQAEKQGGE